MMNLDQSTSDNSKGRLRVPEWQAVDDDDIDTVDRTERRRIQNRRAQRNHRNRVKAYISSLEQRVVESILHDPEAYTGMPTPADSSIPTPSDKSTASPATLPLPLPPETSTSASTTSTLNLNEPFPDQIDYFSQIPATPYSHDWTMPTTAATPPNSCALPPPRVSNSMADCCCDCGRAVYGQCHGQSHGYSWQNAGMYGSGTNNSMQEWHSPMAFHNGHSHSQNHGCHFPSCQIPTMMGDDGGSPGGIFSPRTDAIEQKLSGLPQHQQQHFSGGSSYDLPSCSHTHHHFGGPSAPLLAPELVIPAPPIRQGGFGMVNPHNGPYQQYALVPVPGVHSYGSRDSGLLYDVPYLIMPRYN